MENDHMTHAEPDWLVAWRQRAPGRDAPVLQPLAAAAQATEHGGGRGNGGTSASSPTAPALPAVRTPAPVLVPVARVVEVAKHKPGVDWNGFDVPAMWA